MLIGVLGHCMWPARGKMDSRKKEVTETAVILSELSSMLVAMAIDAHWIHGCFPEIASKRPRMSSARHAVQRGLIRTGVGNRPSRTPCHHVDGETGTIARTSGKRSNPPSAKTAPARSAANSCRSVARDLRRARISGERGVRLRARVEFDGVRCCM